MSIYLGEVKHYLHFNGTNAFAFATDTQTYDFGVVDLDVEVRIRPLSDTDGAQILTKSHTEGTGNGWAIGYRNARDMWWTYVAGGGGRVDFRNIHLPEETDWVTYRMTLTQAERSVRIYKDGIFKSSRTLGGTNPINLSRLDNRFEIGKRSQSGSRYYHGDISYIRIQTEEFFLTEGSGNTITGTEGTVLNLNANVEWRHMQPTLKLIGIGEIPEYIDHISANTDVNLPDNSPYAIIGETFVYTKNGGSISADFVSNTEDTFISEPKIEQVVTLTQAELDANPNPDLNTLYIVPEEGTAYIGEGGYYLEFDGSNDYAQARDSSVFDVTTGDFDMEVEFSTNDTTGNSMRLVDKRGQGPIGSGNPSYQLSPNLNTFSNSIIEDVNSNYISTVGDTTPLPNDGTWHKVRLTWSNSTGVLKIYLDGVETNSVTNSSLIGNSLSTSRLFTIGAANTGAQYYKGKIRSFRFGTETFDLTEGTGSTITGSEGTVLDINGATWGGERYKKVWDLSTNEIDKTFVDALGINAATLNGKSDTDFADSVHTHTASDVTDFDTEVSNNTDVSSNTSARHTHSNKALLDSYDQTNADITQAISDAASAVQPGDLATVATSGQYSDLSGTPSIPSSLSDLSGNLDNIADGSSYVKSANNYTTAEKNKLSGIEANADVTDSVNVAAAGATMDSDTDVSGNDWVLDEDDMASNDATKVPTQQSVKAYVDTSLVKTLSIFNQNADNSVTAIGTTETTLLNPNTGSTTLSVSDCAVGNSYEFTLFGKWNLTSGSDNITLRFYVGGQSVQITFTNNSAATSQPLIIQGQLDFTGGLDSARTLIFSGYTKLRYGPKSTDIIEIPITELTEDVSSGVTFDITSVATDGGSGITINKAIMTRSSYTVV